MKYFGTFFTELQIHALEAGAAPDEALQIQTRIQFMAFRKYVPIETAIQFTTIWQIRALNAGATHGEALHIFTQADLDYFMITQTAHLEGQVLAGAAPDDGDAAELGPVAMEEDNAQQPGGLGSGALEYAAGALGA